MRTDHKEDNLTIGRRQFFNRAGAGALGAIALPEVFAAGSTTSSAVQRTKRADAGSDPKHLLLANERVAFSFDPNSGALKQILHKSLRRTLEIPESAAAPMRIWLGTSEQPDQTAALISQRTQQLTAHRSFNYPGGVAAEFVWQDLKDVDGKETGVEIHQFCTLDNGSEFLRLRSRAKEGGQHIYLAPGGAMIMTEAGAPGSYPAGQRGPQPSG